MASSKASNWAALVSVLQVTVTTTGLVSTGPPLSTTWATSGMNAGYVPLGEPWSLASNEPASTMPASLASTGELASTGGGVASTAAAASVPASRCGGGGGATSCACPASTAGRP